MSFRTLGYQAGASRGKSVRYVQAAQVHTGGRLAARQPSSNGGRRGLRLPPGGATGVRTRCCTSASRNPHRAHRSTDTWRHFPAAVQPGAPSRRVLGSAASFVHFVALDLIQSSADPGTAAISREAARALGDSKTRQPSGPSHGAAGPVFDLIAAKLHRPPLRPGTVRRSSLIERLARGDRRPIISMVAPAGYGKTTVLAQWAERNGQAFAWVSVDEADNDPKVLLTYVAKALDAVEPVGERVFDALASPGSSVPGSVVPRLGSAFSSMASPVALVLDDVHALHNSQCRAALSVLADHVPGGSRMVLAGRAEPPLPIARLRAEGRLLEVGPGHLSLTREEASWLLRNVDLSLGQDEVAELHRRTEGWPAGLYLAALYLKEGGPLTSAAVSFGGDDRLVSEYLESEFLARISRRHRTFLTRTAVLERMCGPLCNAVLDMSGSAAVLADLERSNLLLVPLDRSEERR